MLKAIADINGRRTYIIGLSWGNLDKFRAEPGDGYIRIPAGESGLPVDILIISDRTEADMAKLINIDKDTQVHISDRLKS